jgi:hypothetical protein
LETIGNEKSVSRRQRYVQNNHIRIGFSDDGYGVGGILGGMHDVPHAFEAHSNGE